MSRFLCMALTLCLPLQAAWAGKDAGKSSEELKVEGKLSADDPRDTLMKKSPHQVHEFKMKAGGIYVIELSSKDFDTFLRLEDAKKKQVAYNDDAEPGTLDSRIVYKAKDAGSYRIVATSFDGKDGGYKLSVRPGTEDELAKANPPKVDPFAAMIGKPAPDIVSTFSFNGTTKKLSDLKGNVVLLDFWAVWCGPCIATFPHLRHLEQEYKKQGLEIVGATAYYKTLGFDKEAGKLKKVDAQSEDEENAMLKDFVAHHKLNHRIMTMNKEAHKQAGADYKVTGIPTVFLIDRKGIVRMVRVGSGPENAEAIEEEIRKLVAEK